MITFRGEKNKRDLTRFLDRQIYHNFIFFTFIKRTQSCEHAHLFTYIYINTMLNLLASI